MPVSVNLRHLLGPAQSGGHFKCSTVGAPWLIKPL
jgi:hypothetical protein